MKTTLQTIFDFILSLASLFFRRKRKDQPGQPVADGSGCTGHPAPQHGGSAGSSGGDTLALPTRPSPSPEPDRPPAGPVNMLGWALIMSAVGGYVYKLLG